MDAFPSTLLVSLYRLSLPFSIANSACRSQDLPLVILCCKSCILLPIPSASPSQASERSFLPLGFAAPVFFSHNPSLITVVSIVVLRRINCGA
jgi:hypothetical protein